MVGRGSKLGRFAHKAWNYMPEYRAAGILAERAANKEGLASGYIMNRLKKHVKNKKNKNTEDE